MENESLPNGFLLSSAGSDLLSQQGAGVSAHIESDIEHGFLGTSEPDLPGSHDGEAGHVWQRSWHRPQRNAAQRRLQQQRSDTRMLCKLLAGLNSIDSHRGNTLSRTGAALKMLLTGRDGAPATSGGAHKSICRHWAAGRCTYGSGCRFRHEEGTHPDVSFHYEYGNDSRFSHDGENYYETDSHYVGDNGQDFYPSRNFQDDCKRARLLLTEFRSIADRFVSDSYHESPTCETLAGLDVESEPCTGVAPCYGALRHDAKHNYGGASCSTNRGTTNIVRPNLETAPCRYLQRNRDRHKNR